MRYAITYKTATYTETQPSIDMEKCTSVTFENTGDENLTLNNGIPLQVGNSIVFENLPNEFINQPFKAVFAGGGTAPSLLVIKKFATPVK